ncbi:hypothetical protein NFI96_027279, partial [Prochilodus magdalenae]
PLPSPYREGYCFGSLPVRHMIGMLHFRRRNDEHDASTKAIGAVAYLKAIDEYGNSTVGFILGKAKLVPVSKPTIPRLELCAAVLAVEMAELIIDEIDLKMDTVKFYCDSKVVLEYIHNEVKRFYVYIHNRVQRIRQSTKPEQWYFVPTEQNPAGHVFRSIPASQLAKTTWFSGPPFLHRPVEELQEKLEFFEVINPELDVEVRPEVLSFHIQVTYKSLLSSLQALLQIDFSVKSHCLPGTAQTYKSKNDSNGVTGCKGWHRFQKSHLPDELFWSMDVIIRAVQKEAFPVDFSALVDGNNLPKSSPLFKLQPKVDGGLLRIGRRLQHTPLEYAEKNPLILPKYSHVSMLLVRHYDEQVEHQGRHFTEGAIRSAGLWIFGCKRLVRAVIHKCAICRKLRGKMETQTMADLPPERLSTFPPLTYVGLDVFGPWKVTSRRARGGHTESKRWAVLFTCMSTRAVHIEVDESMDTSSCINALRQFFAIRGTAKQLGRTIRRTVHCSYLRLSVFTYSYLHLPAIICIYLRLPAPACYYLHLPAPACYYLHFTSPLL